MWVNWQVNKYVWHRFTCNSRVHQNINQIEFKWKFKMKKCYLALKPNSFYQSFHTILIGIYIFSFIFYRLSNLCTWRTIDRLVSRFARITQQIYQHCFLNLELTIYRVLQNLMKKVIRCYRVTQWQTNLINTILLWAALGNLAHFIGNFVVNFRDNFKDNLMNNFVQNFRKILWYFSIFSVLFLTKKEAKLVIG